MAQDTMPDTSLLPTSIVVVPRHVVYRSFPSESVVLNLQTGKYHGLNATAGAMLEALEQGFNIQQAAASLAERYAKPAATIERDMLELCGLLLERGLIELEGESAH